MNLIGSEYILYFYNEIDVFLVILARIIAFIVVIPIFTTSSVPITGKISFCFFFSYIIFSSGRYNEIVYTNTLLGFGMLLINEFIVGFILGFVIYSVFSVIFLAGQLIDYQIGFSMMSVFDPISQLQVPIVGNLFYFVITVFFIQSGGIHTIIAGLFYSYDAIPIGLSSIIGNNRLLNTFVELISEYLVLGVQIAIPIMGSILIVDVLLGILVKAVPQMNIFVVGMPLKLFVGLILLYFISPILTLVYEVLFDMTSKYFINTIRSLSP
jgi:flagellar biosynthesis protein FliR